MREIAAFILLGLLIAAAVINVNYLEGVIGEMLDYIDTAEDEAAAGYSESAAGNVMRAAEYWESMSPYTHILLRHAEIDTCSDAFYRSEEHTF